MKVPHIGWNQVHSQHHEPLLWKDIPQDAANMVTWLSWMELIHPPGDADFGLYSRTDDALREIATYLKADYIVIEQQTVKQFYQKLNSGNFDFASWGWLPDYNDILTYADLFASWNGNNVGSYSNPEFDAQVRTIQSATCQSDRLEAAHRIQQIMFEDAAIIPLYETSSAYIVSPRLRGMKRRMFGPDPDYVYAYTQ